MGDLTLLDSKLAKTLVNGADIVKGVTYVAISHTWSMWDSTNRGARAHENNLLLHLAE